MQSRIQPSIIVKTSIFLFVLTLPMSLFIEQVQGQPESSFPLVSTRNHFSLIDGIRYSGHTTSDYDAFNIPGMQVGVCPPEIVIYVHGVWVGQGPFKNNLENPAEIFDRAIMSSSNSTYTMPLIGFSWDSNTSISIDGSGWYLAKVIARDNGPKLAHFILDYKNQCPNTKVRIIAHSLGARVVLSSLRTLENENSHGKLIASVHLMGAAVDNEEVSTISLFYEDFEPYYFVKSTYGQETHDQTISFYNLYNPQVNVLEVRSPPVYYPFYEFDLALGYNGAQPYIFLPENYEQKDVMPQIKMIKDANGDGIPDLQAYPGGPTTIVGTGDNHLGYVGFRSASNSNVLLDDGAMDVIVKDWRR